MATYPFTQLLERAARGLGLEEASGWLVREPSPWQPPLRGDRLTEPVMPGLALAAAEAQAMALAAPEGAHVTFGRDASNHLVVVDATLSLTHLVFHPRPGARWMVQDAGSTNGTALDGARMIAPRLYPLRDGVRLDAGGVTLTFHDAAGLQRRLVTLAQIPSVLQSTPSPPSGGQK
jgi:hypothetical protein